MSELPTTSTAHRNSGRSPLYPVKRLLAERQLNVMLIGFTFLVAAGCVVAVNIAIAKLKQPQMLFVLDSAGNITVGPTQALTKESPIFTTIAGQAAIQFFSRGPGGLDTPEFAQRLFTRKAFEGLMDDVKAELPDLEAKDLRYKPEIREYDLSIPDSNGRRIIRVSGFYTVSGSVDGMSITDKHEFRLTLAMIVNPDLGARGMYPFLVSEWKKVVE